MKIERAEACSIKMPLKTAFETSYGRQSEREVVLVKLYSEGLVGWGEAAVSEYPDYCGETPPVSLLMLEKYFFPLITGRDFRDPAEFLAALDGIKAHPFTATGLETAFIDLYCRSRSMPVYEWLGGTRTEIDAGVSLGIEPEQDALFKNIQRALSEGYKRIKIKIKPGQDVSVVGAIREYFDYFPLMVDANCSYTLEDLDRLQTLDGFHLIMIEQPLHSCDLVDHAELQKRLRTHICLDESIPDIHHLQAAVALGSCRVVNLKFGRVGGLQKAREMAKRSFFQGIAVWCGGMLESGIGRVHNLALNSLTEFSLPGDISAGDRYWEEDIIEPRVVMKDGVIELSQEPGIGHEVVEERIEKWKTAEVTSGKKGK
ncbi:MAG: o-succinylbenzoate synthase [bacterium]